MKRQLIHFILTTTLLLAGLSLPTYSHAQLLYPFKPQQPNQEKPEPPKRTSIFEYLETPRLGEGSIRIFQSPAIRTVVKLRPNSLSSNDLSGGYSVISGFKVQVYSGNASDSKSVAQQRAAWVQEKFPDLETDLQYKAPFWRVRAGNFVTQGEAREYLNKLKKEFPRFGKEMFVVRASIKVPR